MTPKSSRKSRNHVLAVMPPSRVEKLLCNWANLLNDKPAYSRFVDLYSDIFIADQDDAQRLGTVFWIRDLLRRAWDAGNLWHREWFMQEIEAEYHQTREDSSLEKLGTDRGSGLRTMLGYQAEKGEFFFSLRAIEPPEEPTPLEGIMYYFRGNANRLRHCPNPECPAPYFIATKKGQKYCSEACALPAQREAKRRWWNENRAGHSAKE